jgi:universal stress protein A
MPIKQILVPVDFSEVSMQALDYAVDLSKGFDAAVTALFVVEPLYYAAPPTAYGAATQVAMLLDDQRKLGREQLAKLAAKMEKKGVSFRTLLQEGTPYERIAATAKRIKADLIVMATHGRTGLSHLLMGSVAEKVVRLAPCPVLTLQGYKPRKARAAKKARARRK